MPKFLSAVSVLLFGACAWGAQTADSAAFPGTKKPVIAGARRMSRETKHAGNSERHPDPKPGMPIPGSTQKTFPISAVSFKDGSLTVVADSTELGEVLAGVSGISSFEIAGVNHSARVSGVYGPGSPRDILAQILEAAGCNYMMVGENGQGFPRSLVVSPPRLGPRNAAEIRGNPSSSEDGESVAALPPEKPADSGKAQEDLSNAVPLGPGAIEHVPPNESQEFNDDQQSAARSQQNLNRLSRMQEQGVH